MTKSDATISASDKVIKEGRYGPFTPRAVHNRGRGRGLNQGRGGRVKWRGDHSGPIPGHGREIATDIPTAAVGKGNYEWITMGKGKGVVMEVRHSSPTLDIPSSSKDPMEDLPGTVMQEPIDISSVSGSLMVQKEGIQVPELGGDDLRSSSPVSLSRSTMAEDVDYLEDSGNDVDHQSSPRYIHPSPNLVH
ncbi:hypothetical protein U1Q18_014655 [Sarracenia purpurea var. burkii]